MASPSLQLLDEESRQLQKAFDNLEVQLIEYERLLRQLLPLVDSNDANVLLANREDFRRIFDDMDRIQLMELPRIQAKLKVVRKQVAEEERKAKEANGEM
jgi:hypothetical protein